MRETGVFSDTGKSARQAGDQVPQPADDRQIVAGPKISREIVGRALLRRDALLRCELRFEGGMPWIRSVEQFGRSAVLAVSYMRRDPFEACLDIVFARACPGIVQPLSVVDVSRLLSICEITNAERIGMRDERVVLRRMEPIAAQIEWHAQGIVIGAGPTANHVLRFDEERAQSELR